MAFARIDYTVRKQRMDCAKCAQSHWDLYFGAYISVCQFSDSDLVKIPQYDHSDFRAKGEADDFKSNTHPVFIFWEALVADVCGVYFDFHSGSASDGFDSTFSGRIELLCLGRGCDISDEYDRYGDFCKSFAGRKNGR